MAFGILQKKSFSNAEKETIHAVSEENKQTLIFPRSVLSASAEESIRFGQREELYGVAQLTHPC